MRAIKKSRGWIGALLTVCALLSGCGGSSSSSMSAQEFKSKGNAICAKILKQVHAIGAPASESQFASYLKKAIPDAEAEIAGLASLRAPSPYAEPLQAALSEARHATSMLRAFVAKLEAKQVQPSAFQSISKQLGPLTKQIDANYEKAGLAECARE